MELKYAYSELLLGYDILLIVPYGIEIGIERAVEKIKNTLNCTLWN